MIESKTCPHDSPDSCKIESDYDDLDIGSTQHDYYDCVDIEPSFLIYTKTGLYKIDCDIEKEEETIWNWIVDYFKYESHDE